MTRSLIIAGITLGFAIVGFALAEIGFDLSQSMRRRK